MASNAIGVDASDVRLEYLAEGAANIIYRVHSPPASPGSRTEADDPQDDEYPPSEISLPDLQPVFEERLFRLRKALPTVVPVLQTYSDYKGTIAHLFKSNQLVEQILCQPSPSLLKECNIQLRHLEADGRRPSKRHGVYLDENEAHACLITDMSNSSLINETWHCFEFKPKWLVQSPSAPRDARRCRTCALRLRRSHQQAHDTKKPLPPSSTPVQHPSASSPSQAQQRSQPRTYCPLHLLPTADPSLLQKTLDRITGLDPHLRILNESEAAMRTRILHFFTHDSDQGAILSRLRDLQIQMDPHGILDARTDITSREFRTAMTLRDCTLFIKVRF